MVAWVKASQRTFPLRVPYQPSFCVQPDGRDLEWAERGLAADRRVGWTQRMQARPAPGEPPVEMLQVRPYSLHDLIPVATRLRRATRCHGYLFYDVDHAIEARWMHERGLYPLARLQPGRLAPADPVEREAFEAPLPDLAVVRLEAESRVEGNRPAFTDPLAAIRFGDRHLTCSGPDDEPRVLRALGALLRRRDPDVLLTHGGDTFDVPYLLHRIRLHGLHYEVQLGRHPDPDPQAPDIAESSHHTYGRIVHRGNAFFLRGRWHIDLAKKSLADLPDRTSLDGILYLARLCNRRVQEVARNGPGASLQQRQIDKARDLGALLPWKRNLAEREKDVLTLARLDRGGQIFFPRPGIVEDAWSCDFSAYYPAIVVARNLSSDTLDRPCCHETGTPVPDLGLRVCDLEHNKGHQVHVLEPVVQHRRKVKALLREADLTPERRAWAEAVKGELKGVGVVCFGYFRYRNARYGCAEVHQGIQAYGRHGMTRAMALAQEHGFDAVHALTDCLILRQPGAGEPAVRRLLADVEAELKVPMDIEGHYDWVVLLPRNHEPDVGVPNRYYGRFDTGEVKLRGIELRQHRTPPFIASAQQAMLEVLASARTSEGFHARIPAALQVANVAAQQLKARRVRPGELFVAVRASRAANEYRAPSAPAVALAQLEAAGIAVQPGQTFGMLLTRSGPGVTGRQRAVAAELAAADAAYDAKAYLRLLARAAQGLLAPFGVREADLVRRWL